MTDVCYFLLTFHLDCMITLSITSVKCCIYETDTRLWLADCDLAYGTTTMRLGELRNLRLERDSAVLETLRVAETKLTIHCNQRHAAIHWSLVSTVLWLGCQSFCHMIKSSHGQFVSQLESHGQLGTPSILVWWCQQWHCRIIITPCTGMLMLQGGPKKWGHRLMTIILSNFNRLKILLEDSCTSPYTLLKYMRCILSGETVHAAGPVTTITIDSTSIFASPCQIMSN